MNAEPVFVFDSKERWFPEPVEESLRLSRAVVPQGFPGEIAKAHANGPRIDFPAAMKPSDLEPVGYRRVARSGPLDWWQYWLWYRYNPGPPLLRGVGRHEGDWEFVQVGVTKQSEPVLVTLSQHRSGAKREYWALEFWDGRPLVYVALGSHANLVRAGRWREDECDGRGRVLDRISWREFGPWKDWPGLWGNSTGQGSSPQSPARQGKRWAHPHLFHSGAEAQ